MFDVKKYGDGHWMKGRDIPPGETLAVTISGGGENTFEKTGETKAYLDFSDHHQALILNKTRVTTLRTLFGDDPRRYIGQRIGLRQGPPFQGQPSIDIVSVPTQPQPAAPVFAGRDYADADAPPEEEIPFQ
jgi:hypothetical protein